MNLDFTYWKKHTDGWRGLTVRKFIISIISLALLLMGGVNVSAAAAPPQTMYKVYVDGALASSNAIIKNGSTIVPFKNVFLAMGFMIQYDAKTRTVRAKKAGTTITLTVGVKRGFLNGKMKTLPVAPEAINNTTYIPLRFVGESMGCIIEVDTPGHAIYIDLPVVSETTAAPEPTPVPAAELTPIPTTEPLPTASNSSSTELTTKQVTVINDKKVVMLEMVDSQGSAVSLGQGLFLTNYHVIDGQTSGNVIETNGTSYLIGGVAAYNESLDLAIVKVQNYTKAWEAVQIGNPDELEKGDRVVAIGSPRGVQNTVSEGVVSNFTKQDGVNYIQISVPIDHGSSGGGLFNMKGELVGITSAGIDDSNADLNFAISIKDAQVLLGKINGRMFNDIAVTPLASLIPTQPAVQPVTHPAPSDSTEQTRVIVTQALNETVTQIPTSVVNLQLGEWESFVTNDGVIAIFNQMGTYDYKTYLDYYPTIQNQVYYWAKSIGDAIYSHFPDKKISMGIYFEFTFNTYPSAFDPSEITPVAGGYKVTHFFAGINIDGGVDVFVRP
ncbi:trypsin-like peptidase domain-containing protein [Paenibacillus solisilvae]|uniref:Trypsin-like peptidase domain-containing protein n=1 Tax=Paenibacillus solisilvae TaxID=2486751 RepID=A0ABW0VRR9_9BACL